MTAPELADEIGRSSSWLYSNWSKMAKEQGLPLPMHSQGVLVWNRAHVYAWLDRNLSPTEAIAAAAYRAAVAAAAGVALTSDDTLDIERSRAALNRKLNIV